MSAAHTPGPWSANLKDSRPMAPRTITGQDRILAHIPRGSNRKEAAEFDANWLLMTAAPDLLAALERLLDEQPFQEQADGTCECGDGASTDCEHQQARRVIAQARGSDPTPAEVAAREADEWRDEAPPTTTRRTCSWCHTDNALAPGGPTFCPHCQHRADVPRLGCDCGKCRPPA